MRRGIRVPPAFVSCLLAIQTVVPSDGLIVRLTKETLAQAVDCGKSGRECAVLPYQLCPADRPRRYDARLATPFSRVASAAYEAQRTGKRRRAMEPAAVNRWGVGIYVLPAAQSAEADAIQRVEIRREGKVIAPITTTVGPIAAAMPDGSTRQLARGFFTFPPEAFNPSADVTVVFVSAGAEQTCVVDRAHLTSVR
jgi:hypothetical protein